MGKNHRGKPSGGNKEKELGIRPVMPAENLERNEEMKEKHTKGEDELQGKIKEKHPNRNRDKGHSTNVGGYRE